MPNLNNERRLYPRVEQRLPIRLASNGYDFSTTTDNISCIGAYCRIQRYIPPFTKISIKLSLPDGKKEVIAQCKGVVVRTEDSDGSFNVAIFFNEISKAEKQKINHYVNQFVPQ